MANFTLESPSALGNAHRPVKLRNLTTGEQTVDLLHMKYQPNTQSHGCNQNHCLGSIINPKPVEHKVRSSSETLEQARDFINNFYSSIKRLNSPAHLNRIKEIEDQINESGTYYLKETELTYGAKLAWRNAPRCIGRIQWSKLQVFDARFTTNASEMFEALCNHIKFATNKGSLRSAITIFPPRIKSIKNDWRIWNSQLISYAGYRDSETGQVVGDPLNVEITEICRKLGWKGKGTNFDILPLVLSANGGPPEMFPLPDDLILRVKIKHPKFPWFEELGLQWYALPAVSNMMLDVGGLQFTAAPFNGWYMVTEVGTRDLGDVRRYNVLESIAQRMGLNTTSNMSLWKDQAVVELNIAVLDSYQSAGVTIVDHHTASETFMTHLSNEQRLRGGCPADWVWLVPPTSGSTTQVFHQEMINYHLLPNYEYLEPMWKNYDWSAWELKQEEKARNEEKASSLLAAKRKGSLLYSTTNGHDDINNRFSISLSPKTSSALSRVAAATDNNQLTPRKLRFKEIARAVKFTSKLFGKALSRRIKATILYATETGKSERFANKLAQTFSRAFNVHLMSMSEYDMTSLEHEALLLIVTSTFGNGDPPENGELFAKHLAAVKLTGDTSPDIDSINSVSTNPFFQMLSEDNKDAAAAADKRSSGNESGGSLESGKTKQDSKQEQETYIKPLSNVRFGVFALGSTAYPHFCAFGRYVDQTLGELGAERILRCTCGDELCGQEKAFNEWSNQVFKIACEVFCLTDTIGPIDERLPETTWSPRDVRFVPVELTDDISGKSTPISTPSTVNNFIIDTNGNSNGKSDNAETGTRVSSLTKPVSNKSSEVLTAKRNVVRNLMGITNKKIIPFSVKNRLNLHKFIPEENRQTLRIDLHSDLVSAVGGPLATDKQLSQFTFEAGDHIAVYPINKAEMVEKILSRMRTDLDSDSKNQMIDFDQVYTLLVKRENMDLTPAHPAVAATHSGEDTWIPHDRMPVTSIREAITRYLDITSPPNQEFLLILSRQTSDLEERKRLQVLAKNFTVYEDWKNKNYPNLLNVLEEFKTVKFEPALVTQIPLMKPRFYSVSGISTSLTLGVARFTTASGEKREGLCSNYLNEVPIEPKTTIYGYIRSAPAFHMPQDKSIPMLLISAGTGIAPFRAFWQQRYFDMTGIDPNNPMRHQELLEIRRKKLTKSFGRLEMYFGCRNSNYILYKEELDEMFECGVLASVNIAFSRPIANSTDANQAPKKMYVQDKLLEDGDKIYNLIMKEGAHIYVCGDVAMADGVCKTLANIINNSGSIFRANNLLTTATDDKQFEPASVDSAIDGGLGSSGGESLKSNPGVDDGENILMNLRNLNRYHEDIFGAKQAS